MTNNVGALSDVGHADIASSPQSRLKPAGETTMAGSRPAAGDRRGAANGAELGRRPGAGGSAAGLAERISSQTSRSELANIGDAKTEVIDVQLTEDEEAACWAFTRELFALPRVIDNELERATGLALTEYGILIVIAGSALGGMRPSDLAAWMHLTASGLTRVVNRLTKLGLTSRVPSSSDRRSHTIVLTPTGKRAVEASRAAYQACLRRMVLDNLHGLDLTRVTAAFEAMRSQAA